MADIPGYTFIQCLHEGTAASIYRALRNSDNYPVVIKIRLTKIPYNQKNDMHEILTCAILIFVW